MIVMCVNDGAVMEAWAKAQNIEGTNVVFVGDPNSVATRALGVEMTHPGPCSVLGPGRCKRFAMFVENGVIKVFNVSEAADDPAGDARPEASCVEHMLKCVSEL